MTIPSILQKIIQHKLELIQARKNKISLAQIKMLAEKPHDRRDFISALNKKIQTRKPVVIAEIKKASPSKGVIREDFDPEKIAKQYSQHGATCLSVLTEEKYFQGCDADLAQARLACDLPILRKDFIIDEYQLYESKALGADCILLIVAALSAEKLAQFYQLAAYIGLDVLVETHNLAELEVALAIEPKLLGINNRNLNTFETSLNTSLDLLVKIPQGITLITESGLHQRSDLELFMQHGVYGFLIGEYFMRQADPGLALADLIKSSMTQIITNPHKIHNR